MNRLNLTVILASGLLTTAFLTSNSDSAQMDNDLRKSTNEPVSREFSSTLKSSSMPDNTPTHNQTSYETKNGDETLFSG